MVCFSFPKKKTINKNERPKEGIKKGGGITHKWGDRVCVGARGVCGVCADYRFIIIFFIIITAAVAIIIIFLLIIIFIFYHKIIR